MQYLTKKEIIHAAENMFNQFTGFCEALDDQQFFKVPVAGKWSVAENVQHLVVSTSTTTLAYSLPAFIVRLIGGTPNRNSMPYEALAQKYGNKLAAGGRASGRFVPTRGSIQTSKTQMLTNWKRVTEKFIRVLQNKTSESKLDDYLARHPLLGRITLRELCYFTIFHTEHHLNIIRQMQL